MEYIDRVNKESKGEVENFYFKGSSQNSSEMDQFQDSSIFTLNRQLSQESQYTEKSIEECTCKRYFSYFYHFKLTFFVEDV